jgi:hypothetical protein
MYLQQQMGSAIRSHLLLITPRIEFTPQHISELPSITPHISFNDLPHQCPPPLVLADNMESSDVDMDVLSIDDDGDDGDSEEENVDGRETQIPKPAGVARWPSSGGYNLELALGWNKVTISKITVSHIASKLMPILT